MIEFRALGPAHLVGPDGTDPQAVLSRPKLLGVLAYLSVGARRGFHRRDSLIGCFWPELSQERARSAVRQSLYRLRQLLGEAVIETRGDDEVAIAEAEFRSDVAAFEDALAAGDHAAALEVYRGDLLDGLYVPDAPAFERWLDERRRELRARAAAAAWALAAEEADARHTLAAGRLSRQARQLAPLDERLLRRVIRLLDQLGDRAGAVREYESFARRLAADLELEPAPETRALIEEVRDRSEAFLTASGAPAHPAEDAPPPSTEPSGAGALAHRYRIEREIGSGAMATVYRARDLRHQRDVAVKVMHPGLAAQLGTERFLREIWIVANLPHPHIVPVYDSGSDGDRLFYVMPLIEGESLRDRLEREKQLSLEETLRYASHVAEALAYAHAQGIVHRDIKPENILLAGDHALVADFGIARAVSAADDGRLTRTGMAVGTPVYMSPEQASGRGGDADHRSDLYSLACVVYEMLAGQPPFTGATAESIARQHLTTAPRPVTELRAGVPRHVADALDRALAKAPADRFSQVGDFVRALHTPGAAGWPRTRRRRAAALVALAVLLVAGGQAVRWAVARRRPALDPNRVVVVPFENRTGDSALALLGSMAADWITQGLHEIDVIEVVPTATAIEPGPDVRHGAGTPVLEAARRVGAATRAGTVVAGAYYRRGDSLEFQTQIIDAAAERLVRAVAPVTTAGPATGAVLDSLRRRVVVAVAAVLDRRLSPSAAASRPPSLEAYRAYVRGHRAFYGDDASNMREALEFMSRAVALDSTFPDPRFFLIMAHLNLGEMRAADSNATVLLQSAPRLTPYQRATLDWMVASIRGDRAGALRAARARGGVWDLAVEALYANRPHETIEILRGRDGLALPEFYFKWHSLMEALHMVGDHASELREARRAAEVHPGQLLFLRDELQALAALGRVADVDETLDRRLPTSLPYWDLADLTLSAAAELRAHGHRDAGRRLAERLVERLDFQRHGEADAMPLRWQRAMARYAAERWDDARGLFDSLSAATPRDVNVRGYRGVLAARLGNREEARRISDELEGLADPYDHGRDVYWQACIAAQLGERDRAMALLREAYRRGRRFGILLHRDMDLEPLRGYAPFEEFLAPAG